MSYLSCRGNSQKEDRVIAFRDITKEFYNGEVLVTYLDKAHRYYVQEKQPDGSWGKKTLVKGVTTIKDGTLEKKGLMTWPMGLALTELFGFYNFKNENKETMLGFSNKNGGGSLWDGDNLHAYSKEHLLPIVKSASEAWQRRKQQGADIGSIVHDAIEQYITGTPFEITIERYRGDLKFDTPEEEKDWLEKAAGEIVQANAALSQFIQWWDQNKPELLRAEDLVYSRKNQFCGTYDAYLNIAGRRVRADWKTSNASSSSQAAAPQGVYYDFFVQLGGYEAAAQEMGEEPSDDLLVVSARKDGGFNIMFASDLGLTVQDCVDWWNAVCIAHKYMSSTKSALLKGGV